MKLILAFCLFTLVGCGKTITIHVKETPIEGTFDRYCTYSHAEGMPWRTSYSAYLKIEDHETCEQALWKNWGAHR